MLADRCRQCALDRRKPFRAFNGKIDGPAPKRLIMGIEEGDNGIALPQRIDRKSGHTALPGGLIRRQAGGIETFGEFPLHWSSSF